MRGQRELDWERDPWAEEPEPHRRPWYEVISRPPGIAFNAVVAAVVVGIVVLSAVPGSMSVELFMLVVVLLALGLVWLTRLCLYVGPRLGRLQQRGAKGFVVGPVAVAVACGLLSLDVPLRVGFEVSRPQFDRVAEQLLAEHDPTRHDDPMRRRDRTRVPLERRIGVFELASADVGPDWVELAATNGWFGYHPAGPPGGRGHLVHFTALGGGWYAMEYRSE